MQHLSEIDQESSYLLAVTIFLVKNLLWHHELLEHCLSSILYNLRCSFLLMLDPTASSNQGSGDRLPKRQSPTSRLTHLAMMFAVPFTSFATHYKQESVRDVTNVVCNDELNLNKFRRHANSIARCEFISRRRIEICMTDCMFLDWR